MIRISKDSWWTELAELEGFPVEIMLLLRGLISSYGRDVYPPSAHDPYLRKLAVKHLAEGFKWGDEYFEVLVYTPEDTVNFSSIFHMIRKWDKDGKFKRLSEFENQ